MIRSCEPRWACARLGEKPDEVSLPDARPSVDLDGRGGRCGGPGVATSRGRARKSARGADDGTVVGDCGSTAVFSKPPPGADICARSGSRATDPGSAPAAKSGALRGCDGRGG